VLVATILLSAQLAFPADQDWVRYRVALRPRARGLSEIDVALDRGYVAIRARNWLDRFARGLNRCEKARVVQAQLREVLDQARVTGKKMKKIKWLEEVGEEFHKACLKDAYEQFRAMGGARPRHAWLVANAAMLWSDRKPDRAIGKLEQACELGYRPAACAILLGRFHRELEREALFAGDKKAAAAHGAKAKECDPASKPPKGYELWYWRLFVPALKGAAEFRDKPGTLRLLGNRESRADSHGRLVFSGLPRGFYTLDRFAFEIR